MSYSEIIIAFENIIVDQVSKFPSSKSRRNDTSAPMEIWDGSKEDGESVSQEGAQRIMDLALQAVNKKEQAKENGDSAKVKMGMREAVKVERMEGRTRGRRAAARKRAREGWRRRFQNMLDMRQDRTHGSLV